MKTILLNPSSNGICLALDAVLEASDENSYANRVYTACNGEGCTATVWFVGDGSRENIWASISTQQGDHGQSHLIQAATRGAGHPVITIDCKGNAVVAWSQEEPADPSRNQIWVKRFLIDFGWQAAERIDNARGDALNLQITLDSTGNAMATWLEIEGCQEHIYFNFYRLGTGWSKTAIRLESLCGLHP